MQVCFPLQRSVTRHPLLPATHPRIYTHCHTFTATGRIALHEPNIQNIPRDFEIKVTDELREKVWGSVEESFTFEESCSKILEPLASYLEVRKRIKIFINELFMLILKIMPRWVSLCSGSQLSLQ